MKIKGKICKNKNIKLFHISEEKHHNRIFKPRIPKSAGVDFGENVTIARICFSSSMSGAYRAMVTFSPKSTPADFGILGLNILL